MPTLTSLVVATAALVVAVVVLVANNAFSTCWVGLASVVTVLTFSSVVLIGILPVVTMPFFFAIPVAKILLCLLVIIACVVLTMTASCTLILALMPLLVATAAIVLALAVVVMVTTNALSKSWIGFESVVMVLAFSSVLLIRALSAFSFAIPVTKTLVYVLVVTGCVVLAMTASSTSILALI